MIDSRHGWNVSFKPQVLGFVLSLILTFAVFRIATRHHVSPWALELTVITLACTQAIIQLIFFLHLGLGSKPRWNLLMFFFTVFVVFLVIGGSLWIMYNLRYNVSITSQGYQ